MLNLPSLQFTYILRALARRSLIGVMRLHRVTQEDAINRGANCGKR